VNNGQEPRPIAGGFGFSLAVLRPERLNCGAAGRVQGGFACPNDLKYGRGDPELISGCGRSMGLPASGPLRRRCSAACGRTNQPGRPACVFMRFNASVSAGKSCSTTSQTALAFGAGGFEDSVQLVMPG
jgi:hypothetical protein